MFPLPQSRTPLLPCSLHSPTSTQLRALRRSNSDNEATGGSEGEGEGKGKNEPLERRACLHAMNAYVHLAYVLKKHPHSPKLTKLPRMALAEVSKLGRGDSSAKEAGRSAGCK